VTGFFVVQVSCASGSVAGSQLFVTAETISQSGPRCGPRFGQTHNGLARLINDDLISRDFPGAFTRRTRITFIARPYSDAGGAFLHLHHGHPYKHSPFGLEGMCCFAQIAHLIRQATWLRISMVSHRTDIHGKKADYSNVNMEVVNVNQMENGILVNFEDGVCAFFDAAFLYAQMDKRVTADFGDTPAGPLARGW
jgi:hypothetical protein